MGSDKKQVNFIRMMAVLLAMLMLGACAGKSAGNVAGTTESPEPAPDSATAVISAMDPEEGAGQAFSVVVSRFTAQYGRYGAALYEAPYAFSKETLLEKTAAYGPDGYHTWTAIAKALLDDLQQVDRSLLSGEQQYQYDTLERYLELTGTMAESGMTGNPLIPHTGLHVYVALLLYTEATADGPDTETLDALLKNATTLMGQLGRYAQAMASEGRMMTEDCLDGVLSDIVAIRAEVLPLLKKTADASEAQAYEASLVTLAETLEGLRGTCTAVEMPRDTAAYGTLFQRVSGLGEDPEETLAALYGLFDELMYVRATLCLDTEAGLDEGTGLTEETVDADAQEVSNSAVSDVDATQGTTPHSPVATAPPTQGSL